MTEWIANAAWGVSCLPSNALFRLSSQRVAAVQRRLLHRLLQRNSQTEYGRRHGFAGMSSVAEYQARAPLTDYEEVRPWIERLARGEQGLLTSEPVERLEPAGGGKRIPVTASLRAEAQRAFFAWSADLFAHDPWLIFGKAWWSLSPTARGGWLGARMAMPAAVERIEPAETRQYATLLFLLGCETLAQVAVRRPIELLELVDRLEEWGPRLVGDLARGTISPPGPATLPAELAAGRAADPRRADEVAQILRECTAASDRHSLLWPGLRWVSCRADGREAQPAARLARLFPHAQLQGQGLTATEGVVSFPLAGCVEGAPLAYRSHFFEFLPEGGNRPHLAHELERGARYAVVLTTGGGLYRYQLHDMIECMGSYRGIPLLRFAGRANPVSDWFGEKLHALHVERALAAALSDASLPAAFAMLACEAELSPPGYALFIEAHGCADEDLWAVANELEQSLRLNPQYRQCRERGRLAPLRLFRIAGGGAETWLQICRDTGQRTGNLRPAALHPGSGWSRLFRGRFLAATAPLALPARATAD